MTCHVLFFETVFIKEQRQLESMYCLGLQAHAVDANVMDVFVKYCYDTL